MAAPPTEPTPGPASEPDVYVRGVRARAEANTRTVVRFLIGLTLLILVVVVIVTTLGAAQQDSNQTRLQRHGVPVEITVTRCEGVTSGIGQALNYDVCRGNYTLAGRRYNAVIGGNRVAHPIGQTLAGVTVPGDPGLLSTATAVGKRFSPWTPYITPIILAAVTVVLVLGLLLWSRWRQRAGGRGQTVPAAPVG